MYVAGGDNHFSNGTIIYSSQNSNNSYFDYYIQSDDNSFTNCKALGVYSTNPYAAAGFNIVGSRNTFIGCHETLHPANQGFNIVSGTGNQIFGGYFASGVTDSGTNTVMLQIYGYIATGEIRTISGTITGTASDNGSLMLSIDNPFGQAVRVTSVQIEITVQASAAATMDCGIGSSATANYTTMIAALPINQGTSYPYFYDSRSFITATYGTQTISINWATGSGNRYLNFFNPSANASGTVFRATYTITVMGN
jgi:hypothetical protein